MDVRSRKCRTEGCGTIPSFGVAGTKTVEYRAQHAPEGMVDVKSRKCRTEGCGKLPSFGVAGTKTREYCAQHALEGMVDVKKRKCRTEGCGKLASFGVAGAKTGEYCTRHALEGMVDVKRKKCITNGCGKLPPFGFEGTKTVKYCAKHAPNVCCRKRRTKRCGKKPSFGVTNTRTAEYGAQHTRLQCGVEGFRERKVGPHHSGKKTFANVIPSVAKHTSVRPPPKTSQPSGASRDSRKRVRHPEITSTASKRAVAREPTAGVVTMPDIDGQKFPIKQNSSVKVEVHLSL